MIAVFTCGGQIFRSLYNDAAMLDIPWFNRWGCSKQPKVNLD
jgi:hypothetical protein